MPSCLTAPVISTDNFFLHENPQKPRKFLPTKLSTFKVTASTRILFAYLACQPILFLISISIFRKYETSLPVVPGFQDDKKIKKIHFYSAKWLILKTGVPGKYYIIIDRTGKNCQFLKIKIKVCAHQFENNMHSAL